MKSIKSKTLLRLNQVSQHLTYILFSIVVIRDFASFCLFQRMELIFEQGIGLNIISTAVAQFLNRNFVVSTFQNSFANYNDSDIQEGNETGILAELMKCHHAPAQHEVNHFSLPSAGSPVAPTALDAIESLAPTDCNGRVV